MWLVENWVLIVALFAVVFVMGFVGGRFLQLPQAEQIAKVKEWLLYICMEAEKEFGQGTGKLKLRWAFDKFVERFPSVAMVISFETFSLWVDTALQEMHEVLSTNTAIQEAVLGVSE